MKIDRASIGILLITLSGLIMAFLLLTADPIPQDVNYHSFSDNKPFFSIPNALNVLSNLPFLIVGLMGLFELTKTDGLNIQTENNYAYYAFFSGIAFVSIGSGYYHLWPDNHTLVWDRLPMTVAFMGLFSIVISEFISIKIGKNLLFPLLLIGVFSVAYWAITELNNVGDLRLYVAVQFFPMLAIPIILIFFKSKFLSVSSYWWLLSVYILAKLLEMFDSQIHEILLIISGHSLKHIAAAAGLYILLKSYKTRAIRA